MAGTVSIKTTKKYGMFVADKENRQLRPEDLAKRKALRLSMSMFGFLRTYPLSCTRGPGDKLIVKDGQNRLAVAEEKGIEVAYAIEEVNYDVALVNSACRAWTLKDYAQKHFANGKEAYIEGLAFAEDNKLPVGIAFAMLAGTGNFTNIADPFKSGAFVVKDREWAAAVARLRTEMVKLAPCLRSENFLKACMACCRVNEFDSERLLSNAARLRDRLVSYTTRDAFLEMLEDVYNFKRRELFPLKIEAVRKMRERNAAARTAP